MNERRHIERFTLEIPARVVISTNDNKKEIMELRTVNISSGGAFFHTDQNVPEGTTVQADLILDTDRLKELLGSMSYIRVSGQVVRVEDEGIAVSFDNRYEIMPFKKD
jgi:hypothetical protein